MLLTLWALLIQMGLPLAHGPHGHEVRRWGQGPGTSVGALQRPAVEQDAGDDCSLCPICQAMAGAVQALVPQLTRIEVGGLALLERAPIAAQRHVLSVRALMDGVPRGPPTTAC